MQRDHRRLAVVIGLLIAASASAQPGTTRVYLNKVLHRKSANGRDLWMYHFDIQGPIQLPAGGYSWSLVDFPDVDSEDGIGIVDPSHWSKSLSGNKVTFTFSGGAANWMEGAWLPRPAVNSAFKVMTRRQVPRPIKWEAGAETGFAIVDERSLDRPYPRAAWLGALSAGLLLLGIGGGWMLRRRRSVRAASHVTDA